jgi:hypothetical protein
MSAQVSAKSKASAFTVGHTENQTALMKLSTPEQFLISALRLWSQARQDQGQCCCRSLLRNGFQAAGLLATEFESFDRAVTLIDAAQSEAAWIEQPHHLTLTPQEARYLRVLAHCQRDDTAKALHTLRAWLAPGAARILLADLTSFAWSCAVVGLVLPDRAAYSNPAASHDSTRISLRSLSARLH